MIGIKFIDGVIIIQLDLDAVYEVDAEKLVLSKSVVV